MKKLLSFLGALGLTAVGAAGVVSCGSSKVVKAADVKVTTDKDGNATITTGAFDVTLANKATADIKKGDTITGADLQKDFGHLVYFKDGKAIKMAKGGTVTQTVKAEGDIKKDSTDAKVSLTIVINKAEAIELGLVKEDGTKGNDTTIVLGTAKDGKLDKTIFEIDLKASDFVAAKAN